MKRTVLVGILIAGVALAGLSQDGRAQVPGSIDLDTVSCSRGSHLGSDMAVVESSGAHPETLCEELWIEGSLGSPAGDPPPSLVACVLGGGVIVFPSADDEVCAAHGGGPLPAGYTASAEEFAGFREGLEERLSSEICRARQEATRILEQELARAGWSDGWEILHRPSGERCAALGFDTVEGVVSVVGGS